MKRLGLLVGLLAGAAGLQATSVTYTFIGTSGMEFTSDGFINPDSLPSPFPRGAMRWCDNCDPIFGGNTIFDGFHLGLTLPTIAEFEDSEGRQITFYANPGPSFWGNVGSYETAWGSITIAEKGDAVTYAPEPGAWLLTAFGALLLAVGRSSLRGSNKPCAETVQ